MTILRGALVDSPFIIRSNSFALSNVSTKYVLGAKWATPALHVKRSRSKDRTPA